MTDLMVIDNTGFETTGTDIRVFGKWSGAEIQISDMSLEVSSLSVHSGCWINEPTTNILGLYPWSKTTQISSTLGWSFSSETFPKSINAHRRASRLFIDVSRT
jgi:hypothetical protein